MGLYSAPLGPVMESIEGAIGDLEDDISLTDSEQEDIESVFADVEDSINRLAELIDEITESHKGE